MEKTNKYFNDIINDAYEESLDVVNKINSIKKCPSCGGTYINGKCKYCKKDNKELSELENRLSRTITRIDNALKNLDIKNTPINNFFNLLVTLSNIRIDIVNDFLNKYNYYELFNSYMTQVTQRLSNYSSVLTPLDINSIEAYLKKENDNPELITLFKYIIGRTIVKNPNNISYESFEEAIINFTKIIMKNAYSNPVCHITKQNIEDDLKEHDLGSSLFNEISLSQKAIKDLYYEGDIDIINTIFHELTHTIQFRHVFYGDVFDKMVLRELMDHILAKQIQGYYRENYDEISYELEAKYYGLLYQAEFFQSLGFQPKWDVIKPFLDNYQNGINNSTRKIKGKEYDLYELFDEIIEYTPSLLKNHIKLTFLYKLDGKRVIRKNKDELLRDYQIIMNSNISPEEKAKYTDFYKDYINIDSLKKNN